MSTRGAARRFALGCLAAGLLASAPACSSTEPEPGPSGARFERSGEYAVGTTRFELTDAVRSRTLQITAWYPAAPAAKAAAATGMPFEELLPAGPDRDTYAGLLAAAPSDCATRTAHAAPGAEGAASGPAPLLVFSHCHNCLGVSAASIAERLASHGFLVVAPDHAENTLFDQLAGTAVALSKDFLQTRALDVRFVLDQMLDAGQSAVPEILRDQSDATRVGVFGHSFGAVTTGLVLQDDPRPLAGVAIAAPMENALLSGVSMAAIHKPALFLVAKEDNSIGEIGNNILRSNFDVGNPPLVKVEVADAGHWSFSDVCALTPDFAACCGEAQRQTNPTEVFSYLPVDQGIAIASAYVTAFFSGELLGDAAGRAYVRRAHPAAQVETAVRD